MARPPNVRFWLLSGSPAAAQSMDCSQLPLYPPRLRSPTACAGILAVPAGSRDALFSRCDGPLESSTVGLGGQIGYIFPVKPASARLPWPQGLCISLHREPTEGLERLGDARLLASAAESNVAVGAVAGISAEVGQIPVEAEAAREFFGGLSTSELGRSRWFGDARGRSA